MTRSSTDHLLLGVTSLGHDASVTVVRYEFSRSTIEFAAHAERYSRKKNDGVLNDEIIADALYGEKPSRIIWYEKPRLKALRKAISGQWDDFGVTPSIRQHMDHLGFQNVPISTVGHHESHAAGGYFTSGFDKALVVVCDAIGEFATTSVWLGQKNLTKIWQQNYPHSLGLLYSAFTQRIGLKPNEEEYILMGMSALGDHRYVEDIKNDFIDETKFPYLKLKENVHRGIRWWRPDITEDDYPHIAASIQKITEDYLVAFMKHFRKKTKTQKLVFMGGVALNCVANTRIARECGFDKVWIMPNPGDAGSSLGAILAHTKRQTEFSTAYLGHDIQRPYDVAGMIAALEAGEVIGIANGKAEFGPRALGNRSLICDPRGADVKDRVNKVKKREPFRPFAPIIMKHLAAEYFDMPVKSSPYMQFVAKVKRPDLYPAITHYDGTARVQTITAADNQRLYSLLEAWYNKTGCPMLLNTSLNIKGQPLVNTLKDANEFTDRYGIRTF